MNHLTPHIDDLSESASLVRESAAAFFARPDNIPSIRRSRGQAPGYRSNIWQEMAAVGWNGWRVGEESGGSDLDFQAGCVLHEELGAALAPEPLIGAAVLAAGVLSRCEIEAVRKVWLPRVASGAKVTLAWQEDREAPMHIAPVGATSFALSGKKRFVPLADAESFLVTVVTGAGTGIYVVSRNISGLRVLERPRIDGSLWAELVFDAVVVGNSDLVVPAARGQAVLEATLDEARLVLSSELLGGMSAAFDSTLNYIRTRRQFGRAVGSFQAIQHRAVDIASQIELSRAAVLEAAEVFRGTQDTAPRAVAASLAKARTSAAAIEVITACIQLHGGIGYADECDMGLYLKRAMVDASWLGDATEHRRRASALRAAEGNSASLGSRDEEPWIRELRAWIEKNLPHEFRFPPRRQSWREAHSWHLKLNEKGLVAAAWPKEFGGLGFTPYEHLQLHDLFDEFGINIFQNMGVTMLGPLLQIYGTDSQREKYLPAILSGETYWCQGYSEPEAGSDLASLRTTAVLDGDDFVVNGQKIWTSLAHEADMIFVLVRTDPVAKKQAGISFLLADMRSPGITVKPIVNLTGAQDFCSVFFDNVRVPRENLVGELNHGWAMAKSLLGSERIMIGHPRFTKAALHLLHELALSRRCETDPVVRDGVDRLDAETADLECLYVRYLNLIRRGGSLGPEVSLLKIANSEVWQRVVETIRQLSGLEGTLDHQETLVNGSLLHAANQFLHARPATIYGGTNEIQRNILASTLLNLPAQ